MGTSIGRGSRRFRRLREELRAARNPCWICGMPIAYDQPFPHPDSFVVDHVLPWSTHPSLREDPANTRACHNRCNGAKGAGPMPNSLGVRSEEW